MSYENQTTTIQEILRMPPSTEQLKSWVNSFQCVVRSAKQIKTQTGGFFYKATLCDPNDERFQITGSGSQNFCQFEGMMVEIGGQGMLKTTYKGMDEVKLGKNSTIVALTNTQSLPLQTPPPSQNYQAAPPVQRQAAPPAAQSQPGGRKPFGPAIGNCIALAVKCVLEKTDEYPGTVGFQREVYQIASDLLRMNEHMEAGHLARSARDREAGVEEQVPEGFAQQPPPSPPPPPPPHRPSSQPGPQPAFQESEMIGQDEDDIPF